MKKVLLFVLTGFLGLVSFQMASAQSAKVGFVLYDSAVRSHPEFLTVSKNLETYNKQLQDQLKKKGDELAAKETEIRENQTTMAPVILEEMIKEYQQMEQNFVEFQQKVQVDAQKKQQETLAPIIQSVQGVIEKVAKEKGYAYILQRESFVFATPDHDLTQAVIQALKSGSN